MTSDLNLKKLILDADNLFKNPETKEESRKLYEEGLKLAKKIDEKVCIYYISAKLDLLDQNPANAIQNLNEVLELKSNFWKAWHYKGLAYYYLKDENKSIECYNEAINIHPTSLTWLNTGLVYESLNDKEKALEAYKNSLELNPKFVRALNNIGVLLAELGRPKEAMDDFLKILETDPNNERALYNLGFLSIELGDYENAIDFFDNALKLKPNSEWFWYGKINAEINLGHYKEALESSKKATEINQDNPYLWNSRGVAASKLREYEEAMSYFEKSKTLNPSDELTNKIENNMKLIKTVLSSEDEKSKIKSSKLSEKEEKEKFLEIDARNEIINSLMVKYDSIFEAKNSYESKLAELLEPAQPLENNFFLVLRRWNSFTPAMITDLKSNPGGGYFLYWNGKGIVIDPGFDFLDNYFKNGLKVHHIDAVIITHAHIDHCNDFESILTLIFEYNDNFNEKIKKIKKSSGQEGLSKEDKNKISELKSQHKKIDVFMNMGALKKMLSWISLKNDNPNIKRVYTLEKGLEYHLADYNMNIKTTEAVHNEIVTDEYSVGLIFELYDENKDNIFKIGYTSDTQCKKVISDQYEGVDLIITHLGSINEDDFKRDDEKRGIKENHLMLTGVISTIFKSKAKLAIISEFGEELSDERVTLVKSLNNVFQKNGSTRCLTGDIGLKIKIPNMSVKCHYCSKNKKMDKFVPLDDLLEDLEPDNPNKGVIHFCSSCENIHEYQKKEYKSENS
ncbi:Photosystem I assembly protein Ycf3 [anaerobic digester metagenome]